MVCFHHQAVDVVGHGGAFGVENRVRPLRKKVKHWMESELTVQSHPDVSPNQFSPDVRLI